MMFSKTDIEILDYDMDYATLLADGETIQQSDWSISIVTDPALQIDSSEFTNRATKVWLSFGKIGVEYYLANNIITNLGRTYERGFSLQVVRQHG